MAASTVMAMTVGDAGGVVIILGAFLFFSFIGYREEMKKRGRWK